MRRATGHHAGIEHHVDISIHALREEGDEPNCALSCLISISIHALREEGDVLAEHHRHWRRISIHALREEGDAEKYRDTQAIIEFLSTPSARRATNVTQQAPVGAGISIHTLREEGNLELERGLLRFKLFLSTPSARRATP